MFGIGGFELFIILIFGFLIFGPDKLPEIAKTVGKGIARFREAQQEMNDTLGTDKIFDPNNPDEPFKDPVEVLDKIAQRQEEKKAAKAGGENAKASAAPAEKAQPSSRQAVSSAPVAAASAAASGADEPQQESFTERKARYERERAARKAAEKEAAEKAAAQSAASPVPEGVKVAVNAELPSGDAAAAAASADGASAGGDA